MTPPDKLRESIEHVKRQDSGIHEGYIQNMYNRNHIQTLITAAERAEELEKFILDTVINDNEGDLDLIIWKAKELLNGKG